MPTALVFVTLLCGFMELDKGNYRLNRQTDAQQIAASIETGKGKYTYRYGKYSIWTGELPDAAAGGGAGKPARRGAGAKRIRRADCLPDLPRGV